MKYSKHLIAVIGMMMMAAMLSSVVFAAGGAAAADAPELADSSYDNESMTAFAPGAAVLPTQVRNLVAANTLGSGTSIDLRWMSGNPTIVSYPHYRIYYGTSHNPTFYITVGAMTRATIPDLAPVTTYYFKVAAVNASGVGPQSAEVSIMTNTVPGTPTWGTATPHLDSIDLEWIAPSPSVGTAILRYNVYMSTTGSAPFDLIGTSTSTSYMVGDLDISTQYWFAVKAVNAMGMGPLSGAISATTLDVVPNAVQDLTATPDLDSVQLTWGAPAPNGGSSILGYWVYYGSLSPSTLYGFYSAETYWVDITGLAPASLYYFKVIATNAEGNSPDATTSAVTPDVVPEEPTGVSAERDDFLGVDVDWTAPAPNGGTAITGFMIFYGTSEEPSTDYVIAGPSDVTVHIGGLTNALYYFNVVAVNAAGQGEPSEDATATPDIAPLAPTGLHTDTVSVNYVILDWTAPASNGGSAITEYRAYWGTSPSPGADYVSVGPSENHATISGLTAVTLYYFRVVAINAVGYGAITSDITATTGNRDPGVPSITDVTSFSNYCSLTWNAPDANGGSPIDAYEVSYWTLPHSTIYVNVGLVYAYTTVIPIQYGHTTTNYEFWVRAHNANGWGEWSNGVWANAVPSAPVWGSATPSLNSVALDWSNGPAYYGTSITQYNIYYGTEENPTTYYGHRHSSDGTVSGLLANTKYFFRVTAVNDKGEGAFSLNINATTTNVVPGKPTITSVTPGYTPSAGFFITVYFSAPAPNGGSPVTSYNFYSGTSSPPLSVVDVELYTEVMVLGLSPTTTYYFQVSALNALGEGAKSTPIASATTGDNLPGAPAIVSATPGKDNMTLVWTAPESYDGSAVSNYRIYWGTTPNPDNIINSLLVGDVLTAKVTGLNSATRYYFNVVAINALGAGSASDDWMAYTLDVLPGAPTIGTLTPHYDCVDVTWSAGTNTGSPISNYRVYFSTSSTLQWDLYWTVDNVLSMTVYGLDPSTTYYFRVAAVNGAGVGPQSVEQHVATVDVEPLAPTLNSVSEGIEHLTVYWSAPADNGGSPITSYFVYIWTDSPGSPWIVDPEDREFTIGVTPGLTYHFGIKAVNAAGASVMSNEGTGVAYTYPGAPTWSSLTAGTNQVALVWNAPASDGYKTIDYYNVYRSLDGENWLYVVSVWGTSWTNTGLTAGTTYYYQVAAVNLAGEGEHSETDSAVPSGYLLQLTSPNGGESWVMGSIHSITWASSGLGGQLIKIELYKGGILVRTISNGAPNIDSFRWTVTARVTGDYTIKISVVGMPWVSDSSESHFHITSVVRSMALDSGVMISAAPSVATVGSFREVAKV